MPTDDSCLRVRKYGSPTFYTPKLVQPVVDEHGFAILVVDSQEFWENIQPLEIGDDDDRPSIGDTVSVFGPGTHFSLTCFLNYIYSDKKNVSSVT